MAELHMHCPWIFTGLIADVLLRDRKFDIASDCELVELDPTQASQVEEELPAVLRLDKSEFPVWIDSNDYTAPSTDSTFVRIFSSID